MFGFSLIRTDRLKELEKIDVKYSKIHQLYRWFSGWQDLDIIWDYIKPDTYFGGIDECRKKYAKARNTNVYGKANPTKSFEKGFDFIKNDKTYTVLNGPDNQGHYTAGWMEDGKKCRSSFWLYSDIAEYAR